MRDTQPGAAIASNLTPKGDQEMGPLVDKGMDKTTESYMSFTNIVSRKLKRSAIFIVMLTVGAAFFGKLVPGGFIPEEDMGYFFVNYQLPDAASLQRSDVIAEKVESILLKDERITNIASFIGRGSMLR